MSTTFSFHAQLVSIMASVSRTAVLEVGRLLAIESQMLQVEVTRGRNEVASLTQKLRLMEKLLCLAQGHRHDPAARPATSCDPHSELVGGVTMQPIKRWVN